MRKCAAGTIGTISNITKQITSQVESYHQRKLNDKFFDYRIAPVENLTVWEEMIADFKDHGVNQVELFLSDGFVGIKNMLKQYYPNSKFQRYLVHVMRNISQKDRSAILSEFKQSNRAAAEEVLHAFCDKYRAQYPRMVKDLEKIEENLLVFYQYPKQIRASIYSTNMIKRKTKPKAEFPSEHSLDTIFGSQVIKYNDKYRDRVHKGFGQVADRLESYFDQINIKEPTIKKIIYTKKLTVSNFSIEARQHFLPGGAIYD